MWSPPNPCKYTTHTSSIVVADVTPNVDIFTPIAMLTQSNQRPLGTLIRYNFPLRWAVLENATRAIFNS